MIIRAAEPRDLDAIAVLAGQLGYPATSEAMARRLAALGERDAVLVADDGGACVGWIHVSVIDSLESDRFAEIRGLVVDERQRGGGAGAALVGAAEAWARNRGCPRVRVRSNVVRERTHRFYERLGYRAVKSQKVFDKFWTAG
jgi:GNAT superfamily N-acetyltransferase